MRKLLLIAAITFASTAANAGPSRSLSLASADATSADATKPVAEQPKTPTAEPAKAVDHKVGRLIRSVKHHDARSFSLRGPEPSRVTAVAKHG